MKLRREERRNSTKLSERNKKNRMLVIRKRQVAAASLILLIGVAGYLNMMIKDGEADPDISVMYTRHQSVLVRLKW